MKDLFVSYEIALRLKEKGFDEECIARYVNDGVGPMPEIDNPFTANLSAPLYQQVIDWLKAKHYFIIRLGLSGDNYEIIRYGNYEKLYEGIDNMDIAIRETFNLIK